MPPRFKLALALLSALVLACALVLVLLDGGDNPRPIQFPTDVDGDVGPVEPGVPELDTTGVTPTGPPPAQLPDGSGSLVGVRRPSGIDLSDPAVREQELRRMLAAEPVDWQEVARIVGLMAEPIPAALRPVLLNELVSGRRNQVMFVYAQLRDASFIEDLFEMLDDASVIKGARQAVLTALWQMPAGDRDAVVRRLEGRLSGDVVADLQLIQTLAKRGGPEAARAIGEYLQRAANPAQVPLHILQSLDTTDPATAEVLATQLRSETSPKVLKALLVAAAQPGAHALVDPLTALDRDGVPDDVRHLAIDALGRIGDTAAVDFLLRKAAEPGVFGERAVRAIGVLDTAERGVAEVLAKALDSAAANPRPAQFKKSLLIALGNAKSAASLRVVSKVLDDPDEEVRQAAVEAMGRMGHRSRGYIEKLGSLYAGGSETTKRRVAIALGSIGGKEAVVAMERMLQEEGLSPSLRQTLLMGRNSAVEQLDAEQGGE
ncbi:MAG: HEAT repeat domain-containing protein [Planctomycetota bacterium]|nr:HEAT repeat domain-containing protein [Planctomycetota bacterium]